MSSPIVLITLDEGVEPRRGVPFPTVHAKRAYVDAVARAGGLPLLVAASDAEVTELIAIAHGLVITGGAFDLPPALSGASPVGRIDPPKPRRTQFELALFHGAQERGLPVLGVCGGMQLINVALGGTLFGDIRTEIEGALDHEQATSPATPAHAVHLRPEAADFFTAPARAEVNSTHHQAVDRTGADVLVLGEAEDGVVEAIARTRGPWTVGVQWHPELLADGLSDALYSRLVAEAARIGGRS